MGTVLSGKAIVITGARKSEEIGTLIAKQGGTSLTRSLQGTTYLSETEVEQDIRGIVAQPVDWFVLTTGIGLDTLLEQAERLDLRDAIIDRLREAGIAARGYKTFAALKRLELRPRITDEDGTVRSLIAAIEADGCELAGKRVVVQLHGEPIPELLAYLTGRGASVQAVMPYKHLPPEEAEARRLIQEVLDGAVDAVCFTTEVQVRYLYQLADRLQVRDALTDRFNQQVVATAVGKLTAAALLDQDVTRVVVPELERMGAMIVELCKYYGESPSAAINPLNS